MILPEIDIPSDVETELVKMLRPLHGGADEIFLRHELQQILKISLPCREERQRFVSGLAASLARKRASESGVLPE